MAKDIKKKQVLMKMDPRLAQDIALISQELGTSAENAVASLVWLGKRALGRKVKIEGKDEKKVLTVNSFEESRKICAIDADESDTENGSENN